MYHSSERIIKNKVGLLNLAEELENVSRACKVMGLSRETFYRYQRAIHDGGIGALIDKNLKKSNVKNRVDEAVEIAVGNLAVDSVLSRAKVAQGSFGQVANNVVSL